MGNVDEVYTLYRREYLLRNTGSVVVVGFSLLVGLVSMALWATQSRLSGTGQTQRDPLYLYAGLAELAWTLRVGHIQIADNPGRGEPGRGEVAWTNVLAAIEASGYGGWIGLEYFPRDKGPQGTEAGLSWLAAHGRDATGKAL